MNSDAQLPTTAAHTMFPGFEPEGGWHPLDGMTIGVLPGFAPGEDIEVVIEQVVDSSDDLAVADRVAWVLAARCGRQHAVLASAEGFLVAVIEPELDWAAAMRLESYSYAPHVVSVATPEGVLPVLVATAEATAC